MKAGKHAWRSWQNLLFLNIFLNFFKPLSRLAICSLNLIISNILLHLFHIYVFGNFRRRLCPNHAVCLKVAVRIEVFYHFVSGLSSRMCCNLYNRTFDFDLFFLLFHLFCDQSFRSQSYLSLDICYPINFDFLYPNYDMQVD